MPTYEFKDKETGELQELFMKISEKEKFLKDNPNLLPIISAPNYITRTDGDVLKRAGAGWNEVLQKVGEAHPNSKIAETNLRRSTKKVASDNLVKKYKQKHNIT